MDGRCNFNVERFGERLKSFREELGYSLRDVQREVGLSTTTISRAERGLLDLRISSVVALSEWAGLFIDDFVEYPEDKETP